MLLNIFDILIPLHLVTFIAGYEHSEYFELEHIRNCIVKLFDMMQYCEAA